MVQRHTTLLSSIGISRFLKLNDSNLNINDPGILLKEDNAKRRFEANNQFLRYHYRWITFVQFLCWIIFINLLKKVYYCNLDGCIFNIICFQLLSWHCRAVVSILPNSRMRFTKAKQYYERLMKEKIVREVMLS